MMIKTGVAGRRLAHLDRFDELDRFTRQRTFEELSAIYDDIVHMCRLYMENLNLKFPLLIIKEKLWQD